MQRFAILLTVCSLTFSTQSNAQGWLDSLKGMLGFDAETQQAAPNTNAMISMLTDNLGVDAAQASGGLGSLFNYVKGNVSADQFGQLSEALPGVSELIGSMPDISQLEQSGGLSGLMDKAADYSDSFKAVNDVKKQFEALGLKPEMIIQYAEQAKQYLDTEQGQQAKELMMQGLSGLLG